MLDCRGSLDKHLRNMENLTKLMKWWTGYLLVNFIDFLTSSDSLEPLVVSLVHLPAVAGDDGLESGGDWGHHPSEHPNVSIHLLPDCIDGIPELLLGLRVATLDIVLQDGPDHLCKSINLINYWKKLLIFLSFGPGKTLPILRSLCNYLRDKLSILIFSIKSKYWPMTQTSLIFAAILSCGTLLPKIWQAASASAVRWMEAGSSCQMTFWPITLNTAGAMWLVMHQA